MSVVHAVILVSCILVIAVLAELVERYGGPTDDDLVSRTSGGANRSGRIRHGSGLREDSESGRQQEIDR